MKKSKESSSLSLQQRFNADIPKSWSSLSVSPPQRVLDSRSGNDLPRFALRSGKWAVQGSHDRGSSLEQDMELTLSSVTDVLCQNMQRVDAASV